METMLGPDYGPLGGSMGFLRCLELGLEASLLLHACLLRRFSHV